MKPMYTYSLRCLVCPLHCVYGLKRDARKVGEGHYKSQNHKVKVVRLYNGHPTIYDVFDGTKWIPDWKLNS